MRTIAVALAALAVAVAAWAGLAGLAGMAGAGDKGGGIIELDGLKSQVPPTWKATKPDPKLGKFRFAQFQVPRADGDKEDAEVIVSYFGPGSGGGVEDNVKRWKGMFAAAPGKSVDETARVESFKVGGVPITYVDIRGTYLSKFPPFVPNAKVTPKEDYRMINVIFDSKNGPYFIRLLGPARTVDANKKGFDEWVKGFK